MMDSNSIPSDVLGVMEHLFHSGFDAWLVGGAMRDIMLGFPPKDWDLGTNATPQDVMSLFPKVVPIGIRHGTVQVHTSNRQVEVTSFEGSGKVGILRDLGRRDFTVNAMAYSISARELLDPHQGLKDLEAGVLRAVGDAKSRFHDDPLRCLRAGRLVSVYGFKIHRETFDALRLVTEKLDVVAKERIREEMFKMLLGKHVIDAFEWMRKGGVLRKILPELTEGSSENKDSCRYRHCVRTIHYSPARIRVRLAALLGRMADLTPRQRGGEAAVSTTHKEGATAAAHIMERWCMSQSQMRDVLVLIQNRVPSGAEELNDAQIRRLIARVGPALIDDLFDLGRAERLAGSDEPNAAKELDILRSRVSQQLAQKLPLRMNDLAVDGHDVMQVTGLPPGPIVGQILLKLHNEVLDDPHLNDRKILMDFLKRMPY